ncbi:RidA family protein [Nocardiopsis changdeensis]|uniref:RidA family protein n=1 Tax=Nocardiopsis changdeensis TaxID=2831969 RepID=A0ABX8BVG7_9ACTN|nr:MULTISPECIES: RidA family protein [Nocardiopsis]QUX25199.1 RidA family protein [Nocardiopsis changdeensis]QYX35586.1 RidA family protein [Nocardiopsis sp. MT53]
MGHTVLNPAALHDPTGFGYSHLARTEEFVFVAGQYASDAEGGVASDGFAEQVERSFANLETALEAAGVAPRDVVRLGTYVVGLDLDRLGVLTARIARTWGDRPPTQTLLGVAGLALPGMLFEVDAVAVRPRS